MMISQLFFFVYSFLHRKKVIDQLLRVINKVESESIERVSFYKDTGTCLKSQPTPVFSFASLLITQPLIPL